MSVRTLSTRAKSSCLCLALLGAVLSGCKDNSHSSDNARHGNDAEMTAPDDAANAASRNRDRLRMHNTYEWVGVAHNRLLDDFRAEMRKPGLLTRNVCEYVMSFSMSDDRVPAGHKYRDNRNWAGVRAVADSSSLCSSGGRKQRLSNISYRWELSPTAPTVAPQSTEASSLVTEIETAVVNAADARDLATRLQAIHDRSLGLPEVDQALVASTISVAQNSFEYWSQQYGLFEQEIIAEYAPCIDEQLSVGATDGIIESCLTGKGSAGAIVDRGSSQAPRQRLVRAKPSAMCGISIREGFRKIGSADAGGAAKAFMAAMFSSGFNLGVGGLAALAGGGAASTWAAIENAIITLKCMYGMT